MGDLIVLLCLSQHTWPTYLDAAPRPLILAHFLTTLTPALLPCILPLGRKSAELKGPSDEDAAYLSKHRVPAKVSTVPYQWQVLCFARVCLFLPQKDFTTKRVIR